METYEMCCGNNWNIAIQYFKDGVERVPLMDYICLWTECYGSKENDEQELDRHFKYVINKPYSDHVVYSRESKERVEGFVYGGERLQRSLDLTLSQIQEFTEVEKTLTYPDNKGYIREIWKFHFTQTWRGMKTYTEKPDGSIAVEKSLVHVYV